MGYFKDAHIEFIVKCVRLIEEDKNYLNNIKKIFKTYHSPDEKFRGINESLMNRKSKMKDTMMMPEEEEEETLPQVLIDKLPFLIREDFDKRFADKKEREDILNETLNLVK